MMQSSTAQQIATLIAGEESELSFEPGRTQIAVRNIDDPYVVLQGLAEAQVEAENEDIEDISVKFTPNDQTIQPAAALAAYTTVDNKFARGSAFKRSAKSQAGRRPHRYTGRAMYGSQGATRPQTSQNRALVSRQRPAQPGQAAGAYGLGDPDANEQSGSAEAIGMGNLNMGPGRQPALLNAYKSSENSRFHNMMNAASTNYSSAEGRRPASRRGRESTEASLLTSADPQPAEDEDRVPAFGVDRTQRPSLALAPREADRLAA